MVDGPSETYRHAGNTVDGPSETVDDRIQAKDGAGNTVDGHFQKNDGARNQTMRLQIESLLVSKQRIVLTRVSIIVFKKKMTPEIKR